MAFEEQVEKIVGDIWTSMLNIEIQKAPVGSADRAPDKTGEAALCGCVHISGDWQGAVILYVPKNLASVCTESMFAMDPGTAGAEEIRDAIGELTNMVGGNFKSILEGSCTLSIPSVIQGEHVNVSNPGCETVSRLVFNCADKPLSVIVQKKG